MSVGATCWIVTPDLGEIEAGIDQGGRLTARKAGANSDLTIFYLPQAA